MAVKRVLIVDDEHELGRMLRSALQTVDKSLDIRVVPSAEEALLEITSQPLSLVIADIRLPGMSGLDLVSRIHSRSSETRILVISGLAGESLPEQAQAAGADRFMRKPLHMSDFLTVASELLGLPAPDKSKLAPAAEPAETPPPAPQPDLAGALLQLRNTVGAPLVLLADDTGRVLVKVGERADLDFENQWAPAVMSALSAAQKAGRLINPGMPQGALILRGSEQQLVLAPVGNYALVILLGKDATGLRTALILEETLSAQSKLEGILDRLGAHFRPIAVAQTPEQLEKMMAVPEEAGKPERGGTEELKELHTKLKDSEKKLDKQAADDFWEKGLSEPLLSDEPADVLTYDEARRLGLTPDND